MSSQSIKHSGFISQEGKNLDHSINTEISKLHNAGISNIEDVDIEDFDDENVEISDPIDSIEFEDFQYQEVQDEKPPASFFQKAISYIAIAASISTLPIVGLSLPILNEKDSQTKEDFMKYLRIMWGNFETKAPIIAKPLRWINLAKESIIKNSANLLISTVNILLFVYNGSSIPFLKNSIVADAANYIAKELKNGWNKLEKMPYIGAVFRGIKYANEKKVNFLSSRAFSSILSYTFSTLSLGFGPIGLGVATAATSIDVAVGAMEVNNAKVIKDELLHLRSIFESLKKIEALKLKLGIKKTKNLSQTIFSEEKNQMNIYRIFRKSASLLVSAQLLNLVNVGVKGITSPIDLANLGTKAAISAAGIVYGQITEDSARFAMQAEIIELRKKISTQDPGFFYDISKSRKYDLGEKALEYAVYCETLKKQSEKQEVDIRSIREEIKANKLFNDYRCKAPKDFFEYTKKAFKTSLECAANYLHPFKQATNYISVCKEIDPQITSVRKNPRNRIRRSKSEPSISSKLPTLNKNKQHTI